MNYPLSIFIFRRDLRLQDNTALIAALKQSNFVIPCFIFDKRQIENNPYKSSNAIQFMVQSLLELQQCLRTKKSDLYFFYGEPEFVIEQVIKQLPIRAIYVNRDYTPYSRQRDQAIAKLCTQHNIAWHAYADTLLHEPEEIKKANNQPYTIFTPYFKKAAQIKVADVQQNKFTNYYNKKIANTNDTIIKKLQLKLNKNLLVKGGRVEGLTLLKNIRLLREYQSIRNYPSKEGTTHLSAHIKFGTVSIREVYHKIVNIFSLSHTLISELYWRDFFTHINYHFPHVYGHAFNSKYDAINWKYNEKYFRAWCEGKTGFPIIDAGMRELNTTGYMHNRVRMLTASFLIKDLHINWLLGEKYFAQQLTDYDPAVNNGNWQWAASTGCDAQPYFRIFNPWLQQQKFDPHCLYIKKFIPELALVPNNIIHHLHEMSVVTPLPYIRPLVNHQQASLLAKKFYS